MHSTRYVLHYTPGTTIPHCCTNLDVARSAAGEETRSFALQLWQERYQKAVKKGPTLVMDRVAQPVSKGTS